MRVHLRLVFCPLAGVAGFKLPQASRTADRIWPQEAKNKHGQFSSIVAELLWCGRVCSVAAVVVAAVVAAVVIVSDRSSSSSSGGSSTTTARRYRRRCHCRLSIVAAVVGRTRLRTRATTTRRTTTPTG